MFSAIIGPISSLAGTWLEGKVSKAKAETDIKVAKAQAEAEGQRAKQEFELNRMQTMLGMSMEEVAAIQGQGAQQAQNRQSTTAGIIGAVGQIGSAVIGNMDFGPGTSTGNTTGGSNYSFNPNVLNTTIDFEQQPLSLSGNY